MKLTGEQFTPISTHLGRARRPATADVVEQLAAAPPELNESACALDLDRCRRRWNSPPPNGRWCVFAFARDYLEVEPRAFCARAHVPNSLANRNASRLLKS